MTTGVIKIEAFDFPREVGSQYTAVVDIVVQAKSVRRCSSSGVSSCSSNASPASSLKRRAQSEDSPSAVVSKAALGADGAAYSNPVALHFFNPSPTRTSRLTGVLKLNDELRIGIGNEVGDIRSRSSASRETCRSDGLAASLIRFVKDKLRSLPVMISSRDDANDEKPLSPRDGVASTSASLASLAVTQDAEAFRPPPAASTSPTPAQRLRLAREQQPRASFSCFPAYAAIFAVLLVVLIIGAVTTILDVRPAFLFGLPPNSTSTILDENATSLLT